MTARSPLQYRAIAEAAGAPPLSGGGNFRNGTTPYDNLTISVKFADGIAIAEDIRVEGPAAAHHLSGTASVPARGNTNMKRRRQPYCGYHAPPGFVLPFVVQGPWEDPLIFPIRKCLIGASPASAPLASTPSRTEDPRRRAFGAGAVYRGGLKPETPMPPSCACAGATGMQRRRTDSGKFRVRGRISENVIRRSSGRIERGMSAL